MCKEYNGWTNWETWNIMLWTNEVDGVYDALVDIAKDMMETEEDDVTLEMDLKDRVEQYITDIFFDEFLSGDTAGPIGDAVIVGYLQSIDWYSIASHVLKDAKES